MTTELVTTDFILSTIKQWVEEKQPVSPDVWLDASFKLAVLLGDENAKLFNLQEGVAKAKLQRMESGDSAAKARIAVEASPAYTELCIQKAKIEQIHELIRISKLQARHSFEEFRSQR